MGKDDVVLTDRIRRAVFKEICDKQGHQYDTSTMLTGAQDGTPRMVIGSEKDPLKMPHLSCSRCGRVWLVIADSGKDYEDAEQKLTNRLSTDDVMAQEMKRRRDHRRERDRHPENWPKDPPPLPVDPLPSPE